MLKRRRRRYLALKILSARSVNNRSLLNAIWDAIYQLFGEYGASQVNVTLIECESARDLAVIRCSHTALEVVRASIASITEINDTKVVITVLGVSGTLKSLRKKFLV